MKWWPASLAGRLLAAFVFGAAGVAALAITMHERDAARAATRRAVGPAPPELLPPLRPGPALVPCGGRVLLATRLEAVAPDAAPVVQVLPDGSVALRRPAPLAATPSGGPATDAAVLLPVRSLGQLDALARTVLLDRIGQLVAERPVPSDRVQLVDVEAEPAELEVLLGWLP